MGHVIGVFHSDQVTLGNDTQKFHVHLCHSGAEHVFHESDVLRLIDGRLVVTDVEKVVGKQGFDLVPLTHHDGP